MFSEAKNAKVMTETASPREMRFFNMAFSFAIPRLQLSQQSRIGPHGIELPFSWGWPRFRTGMESISWRLPRDIWLSVRVPCLAVLFHSTTLNMRDDVCLPGARQHSHRLKRQRVQMTLLFEMNPCYRVQRSSRCMHATRHFVRNGRSLSQKPYKLEAEMYAACPGLESQNPSRHFSQLR